MRRLLMAGVGLLATAAAAAPVSAAEGEGRLATHWDSWDRLWHQTLTEIWVIGIVFGVAALYWMFKYRAKNPDDVGHQPKLSKAQAIAWALIPAAVFMAIDFFMAAKGWVVWNEQRRVPEGAMEVKVNGYQWYWEFDYGNGVTTQELVIPVGKPVVLRMKGQDVIHSFFVPDFRVKEDLMPGRVTYVWFFADKPGEHVATCTEYCGTAHSGMYTQVRAIEPAEWDAWMTKAKAES